ncbi:MAG TPA: hypothetical protein VGM91_18290 [Conexibacter sp.]|jgi:ribose transport system permease protein
MARDLSFRFATRYRVVWLALALIVALCAVDAPTVFHAVSLQLVFGLAGVLAIASAGQLLVVMLGGIDLSVPAVMTFAGAILVHQSGGHDGRLAGAVVLALAVALAIGLVNGLLIAVVGLNALIVTLAMSGVVGGVSLLWIGATYSPSGEVPAAIAKLAGHDVGPVSVLAFVGLGVLLLLGLALRSSRVGRSFVCAGTNPVAARVLGVRVTLYEVGGYALAAVLYAVAGLLLAGLLKQPNATLGDPYQLGTIVAVALGGASLGGGPASFLCTAGACVFLGFVDQYLQLKGVSGGVSQLVNGALLVLAVALVAVGARGRALLAFVPTTLRRIRRAGATS